MPTHMDILAKNLLILASAGSGKTFQLGNRVIGLVARGADPEKIVALTFTRKAAGEFADAVLSKLAGAASSAAIAGELRQALSLPNADFTDSLDRVVRALPRLTLGTMDGFFAKVIRGFQYEMGLTGGKFSLLEGPHAAALADELIAEILGDALAHEQGEEFFHAFRRATIGREDPGVLAALRDFVTRWQSRLRETRNLEWGPATMVDVSPGDWEKHKSALAAKVLDGLGAVKFTRKGQLESLQKEIGNLADHVIGGGSLGNKPSTLLTSILTAAASGSDSLTVKSHKEFTIGGPAGEALRTMVVLAARCELAAALLRTRAVRDLVAVYDARCATQLRQQGLLGFDDVKILMGEWAASEDARLRREAVDFRLDARTDHWLLDEFQDTSRADWTGLLPLIDEGASAEDGTVFIVGDRKQAIYAWRGGDVGLFDEVMDRYVGGLEIAPMTESWRSCPEVLALVNQVCGDMATLRELFGATAARWDWQDHVSASPLTRPANSGEARVEVVGDWDERMERLAEILHELGIGQRAMTCGVLLRGNTKARKVADFLREQGFDVIEEGRRQPAQDNPVGIVIAHLLKWLANPADPFAREVIEMSPLAGVLRARHGSPWRDIWQALTEEVSQHGFAGMIEGIIEDCWPAWSDFGRRRSGDLLAALATLDSQGGVSPREAAAWLERLEVSQSPGVAAVQVMTVHKAKGLGFDVVVLPEVPDESCPQAQHFDVAEGADWLTQTPPQWARAIVPEMRDAEALWAANQQYEALCTLYVALTRAKRGLYVLLEPPAASAKPDKASLANWLARSVGTDHQTGVIYHTGTPAWVANMPMLQVEPQPDTPHAPGAAIPRRPRMTPSAANRNEHAPGRSSNGIILGTEIHALLERVAWVDESPPSLPVGTAGKIVAQLLHNPDLQEVFARQGRPIDLFREQPTSAILDGKLLTGTIDRLLLHHRPDGTVTRVDIIDYKTDAVKNPADLIDRYSGQMTAYRNALLTIYPNADVRCSLLCVHHGTLALVP
jgi:ATP-dependent exoDNAse (exonuclease V) beta subunit